MEVKFRTNKLERCYQEASHAIRTFGEDVGKRYILRINIIKGIKNIYDLQKLPGLRCHPLKGNHKGQWALSLTSQYGLIFILKGEGEVLEIARIEEASKHYDD